MERAWKLGDDLDIHDNLLDGFSFGDLVLAVHCNCENITKKAVRDELKSILESRIEDMVFLVENNMDEIMIEAKKGRAQYEEGNG